MKNLALLVLACVGCGDDGPAVGAIELSSTAALLTHEGDATIVTAQAFDPDGAVMTDAVTWQSSNPGVVAVDQTGTITALAAVGSSQITAKLGDKTSKPMLIVVAEPAPGAVLIADAQVIGAPALEDPTTPLSVGSRMTMAVTPDVALAPGSIVLARDSHPIAGRVISADNGTVVFEAVPVPELFRRLDVEDTYAIDQAAFDEALAEDTARIALPEAGEFNLGPLKCKALPSFSAIGGDVSISITPDLSLRRHLVTAPDGSVLLMSAVMTGSITGTGHFTVKADPTISGTVSCKYKMTTIKLPLGGPISVLAGFRIPIGLKGELTFGLHASLLEIGGDITVRSETSKGFTYTPDGGYVPIAEDRETTEYKPVFERTESGFNAVANGSVSLAISSGLEAGISLPLLGDASLELLDASAGVKVSAELTHKLVQLAEPANASSYNAKAFAKIAAGADVVKAMTFFDGALEIAPSRTFEHELGRSPIGVLEPSLPEVQPGDTVRFKVNLDERTAKFLSFDNVKELTIYRSTPGGMVEVAATIPGNARDWEWHPTFTDLGTHTFWATVTTTFAPGIELEIKADSHVEVHVGPRTHVWNGSITWTASGDETKVVDEQTSHFTLTASGSSMVRQSSSIPEFFDEISGTGNVSHTGVITVEPVPPFAPSDCVYRTVTTTTTTGNSLAPPSNPTAQLAIDETTGVYTLFFKPTAIAEAAVLSTTVSTLVAGPDFCEEGGTTTSEFTAGFAPEEMIVNGSFTPGASTFSGTVTLATGLSPVADYTMNYTFTHQ